jgi:hypothetical protein
VVAGGRFKTAALEQGAQIISDFSIKDYCDIGEFHPLPVGAFAPKKLIYYCYNIR